MCRLFCVHCFRDNEHTRHISHRPEIKSLKKKVRAKFKKTNDNIIDKSHGDNFGFLVSISFFPVVLSEVRRQERSQVAPLAVQLEWIFCCSKCRCLCELGTTLKIWDFMHSNSLFSKPTLSTPSLHRPAPSCHDCQWCFLCLWPNKPICDHTNPSSTDPARRCTS